MSINLLDLNQKKCWQLLLVILLFFIWTTNLKVKAQSRGTDVFSVNSANQSAKTANSSTNFPWQKNTEHTPAMIWFEKFDQLCQQYRPTERDKVIITRPLMQNAQRVQQWTNTASKISKNYILLAKSIRSLTVPAGMTDIKDYRELVADWYQDSAGIYNDLIRPRPPAKTIEDLQEEIDAVKKRAEGLANNMANLKAMDREVREAHKVPGNMQDDAVQKFIHSK